MFIDILFLFAMITALIKGYTKGLIVALFSFAAIIIGLAAALKLSSVVAVWLQTSTSISSYWLPFLSFALVMLGVIVLVRMGAKIVEKTIQFVMMGWVNKIGGILLYAVLYISLLSVIIFFFDKMHLLKQETIAASKSYSFIQPWGPKVIAGFSKIIPIFKDVFQQLENFFQSNTKTIGKLYLERG
jgi:membrane protein required for colicin V production